MISAYWQSLKDFVRVSYELHPLNTVLFGGGCFVLGMWLG